MDVSQRASIWLLGGLVGFLLLLGADMYARLPRPSAEDVDHARREQLLKTWKPAIPILSAAPDFTLKDRSGRSRSLSEFRDRPTLLCFYSDDKRSRTWAREMQKLWNYVGRSRIHSVVVVSFSREAALAFARETKDASLYLFEDPEHHPVRDRYGAVPGPNAWVVDRKGKIQLASPPILTDGNPDEDFGQVYQALRALTPTPTPQSDLPAWAQGKPRPPADDE